MVAQVLVMTGAGGRLGRLCRLVWAERPDPALRPIYLARRAAPPDLGGWDILSDAPPPWPEGATILHLAGALPGGAAPLAANVGLAQAVAAAARRRGAARVILASSVAVYAPGPQPLSEAAPPRPISDYGRAKWQAEQALAQGLAGSGIGLCALRIANVAGADALLGGAAARSGPVLLDPVAGQAGGPERSYIGPRRLALALWQLARLGPRLPPVLNLAQPGALAMAGLLDAAGLAWGWGPPRPGAVARVAVDTAALQALLPLPLPPATAAGLVAEWAGLRGAWP